MGNAKSAQQRTIHTHHGSNSGSNELLSLKFSDITTLAKNIMLQKWGYTTLAKNIMLPYYGVWTHLRRMDHVRKNRDLELENREKFHAGYRYGSPRVVTDTFEWLRSLWDLLRLYHIFPILDDLFFLVGHLFMALFSKNWASRLVRNIAPTRELESFGPSLRGDLFDAFQMVCELSDCFTVSSSRFLQCRYFLPFFSVYIRNFRAALVLHFAFGLFIYEMAKKKSCQNIRIPCVLSAAERDLYASDELPELRREMRLTEEVAPERDYMLEAADPSDRLSLQAPEDRTHFRWVYVELFTRLGVRLPFTDFQREVMARCRVAASQLHLNSWGFLRTF
ncbi:hypothetical protein PIB30_076697 [Stylosanthes scabra]|uniref:Uncharacterized protein n=1 Tax=Stylosanthes scabra TaxID=79078 RepID=A0ABU6ZP72_9FABA|nr:hypothetical protein [Stylosanthes scabra]